MQILSKSFIKAKVADSDLIYTRGESLYQHGAYYLESVNIKEKEFIFRVDGAYGVYDTRITFQEKTLAAECSCPYPGNGCRHVVAGALKAREILIKKGEEETSLKKDEAPFLSGEEILALAMSDREKRARLESFTLVRGDMILGDHLVVNQKHKQYRVTLHDPSAKIGHCSCPDYITNSLGTCKHIHFLVNELTKEKGFKSQLAKEKFPFIDVYWDSKNKIPALFPPSPSGGMAGILAEYFDDTGRFRPDETGVLLDLMDKLAGHRGIRIRESLIKRITPLIQARELSRLSKGGIPELPLKARLYPYQKEGVDFGLYKPAVLIGDEMGLGKTLQAISLGLLKKEVFGFKRILVITLASLKEQWKREIEKFTHEKAVVVEGGPDRRKEIYFNDKSLFKITNYEAVLRDVLVLSRFNPDLIILDEAQRIKNFSTKTADAVKSIPKRHGVVLTGTPLENKLEDVYSIVQFLDAYLLSPLWEFASDHFLIPRKKTNTVSGYKNLSKLSSRLKPIVIRRKKEDVLEDLPKEVINNYYIDLTREQSEIHNGFSKSLLPLLNKKFLTPIDLRKIQMLLLKMRQVCDSTFLIDRDTQISPKMNELEGIIEEVVVQNNRKMVIFSEWTSMTFLIANTLSDMNVPFVELSGKVPVKKRQALIDEFTDNPDCGVFLSTDAGGTGLNLQAADCVVNFELPWNPARMNQRIGRVNRIGQTSKCVNVINLIAKQSIEERILASIQLKTDLFKGVFDEGGPDSVEFSREKRNEMLNRLREMMGESPELPVMEAASPEEIPEDTPHYLNPKVLKREKDLTETPGQEKDETEAPKGNLLANQAPEKVEAMLNSGMQFMSQLMEMATGRKIEPAGDQDKMIEINRETREVTMKFKLPEL